MFSFIIIGRNEGWKLTKCINSVYRVIHFNNLKEYEIIYCDSDSSDNSVDIVRQYKEIKVYRISGHCNAAIARNAGARACMGEILIFLDGDIELKEFKIDIITNDSVSLKYDYISGFIEDVNYTNNWEYINKIKRGYDDLVDKQVTLIGGAIFILERKTWLHFNGMDERLKTTEDRDLCLRLARNNKKGIRKKDIMGQHHTIPYSDSQRMWKMMFGGFYSYKALLMRKHILNKYYLHTLFREEYTMIILLISTLFVFTNPACIIFYVLSVIARNKKYLFKSKHFVYHFFHRIMRDVMVLVSLVCFFPRQRYYKVSKIVDTL